MVGCELNARPKYPPPQQLSMVDILIENFMKFKAKASGTEKR